MSLLPAASSESARARLWRATSSGERRASAASRMRSWKGSSERTPAAAAHLDQALGAQDGEGAGRADPGRALHRLDADGPAGHGDHLEQAARRLGQPLDAAAQHVVERDRRPSWPWARAWRASSWTMNGLPPDSRAMTAIGAGSLGEGVGRRREEGPRQRPPPRARRAAPPTARATSRRARRGPSAGAAPRQVDAGGVLAAVATTRRSCGGVGRGQHVEEERGAVGVAPLEIVDGQHQRRHLGDALEEAAQRLGGAAAGLLGVERLGGLGHRGHRGRAAQHRGRAGPAPGCRRGGARRPDRGGSAAR